MDEVPNKPKLALNTSSGNNSPDSNNKLSKKVPSVPPSPFSSSYNRHSNNLLNEELFNFSCELPRVPYAESPNSINRLVLNPIEFEKYVWLGVCACFDALFYCFSFLPVKIAISSYIGLKSIITGNNNLLFAKHIHALIQGFILVTVLFILFLFSDYTNGYIIISKITWTKLYVLFGLFAVLDLMLERVGKRLTGHLSWSVSNSNLRGYTCFITVAYVLIHCYVLILQMNVIANAIDTGQEMLGLLVSVKVTDLKDGWKSFDRETLFRSTLSDIGSRFKWIIFLLLIAMQKFTKIYTIPKSILLATNSVNSNFLQLAYNYSGQVVEYLLNLTPATLLLHLQALFSTIYSLVYEFSEKLLFALFSPSFADQFQYNNYNSNNIHAVNFVNQNGTLKAVSNVLPSAVNPQNSGSYSYSFNIFGLFSSNNPAANINTELQIDSLTILHVWLPYFLYSALMTLTILCLIDWLKHCTLALFNMNWLDNSIYVQFQQRVSAFYLNAPKLGLGENETTIFALAHFDFMNLPFTILLVRELFTLSLAVVNSCWYSNSVKFWLNVEVWMDYQAKYRCSIYNNTVDSTKTLNNSATSSTMTFFQAALLLLALRIIMFLTFIMMKIIIRLILRGRARYYQKNSPLPVNLKQNLALEVTPLKKSKKSVRIVSPYSENEEKRPKQFGTGRNLHSGAQNNGNNGEIADGMGENRPNKQRKESVGVFSLLKTAVMKGAKTLSKEEAAELARQIAAAQAEQAENNGLIDEEDEEHDDDS
jgi:hypothetical protein